MLKSGKKGNIVVPAGVDLKGWERFRHLLLNFLNVEDDSRAHHFEKKLIHKPSFGIRPETYSQLRHPLRMSNHGQYPSVMPSQEEGECLTMDSIQV